MLYIKNKKISGSIIFFGSVIGIFVILSFFNINFVIESLINTWRMIIKIIPILGFVFIFSVFINLYLKNNVIKKYLGKDSGIKGWLYAIFAGILIAGPPYILYPMLGELKKAGVKNSLLAVFLYNRNIKIPFIPVMILYFGLSYTIVISLYILLFSILNGILVELFVDNHNKIHKNPVGEQS